MKNFIKFLIIVLSFLTLQSRAQAKYYVNSNIGQPWGSNSNITCMNTAFGVGNWTQGYFETINPNALFSNTVCIIFLEGSNNNATALNNFLASNTVLMQNWVFNGGKLFLNAAPVGGGNMNFGFGGTFLFNPMYTSTTTAYPGMASYPVFLGPAPSGISFSGNYYGHGTISGGTVVPILTGTLGQPVLADRFYGLGHVFFGGATTTNWHSPAPGGTNLRVNILNFLGGCCGVSPSITAVASPSSICAGQSVTITSSGAPGGSYNVYPGSLTGSTVVVSPTVSTNYNIIGTPTAGCAGGTTIRVIVGASSPTLSITGNTSICPGGTVNLTVSGANTYTWNTGAFTNTISQTPVTNTLYSVVGTASTGCTGTVSQNIIVNPNPTITISGGSVVCSGSPIVLTAGGANSYSWSTGALTSTIAPTPTINTTYSVIGTTSAGCTGSAALTVSVGTSPTVTISGTNIICQGQSAALSASGANSYSWSTGALTSTIAPSPGSTTTYSVVGTNTSGCSGTAMHTVTVAPSPSINVTGSNSICQGQAATLTASGANSFTWSNGPLTSTMSASPPATTNYTVVGTNTLNNCSGTFTTSIIVLPNPTVSVSGSNVSCSGSSVNLAAGGANTYSWSNGALTSTIAPTPSVNTTYSVIGTSSAGCTGTAAITVSVSTSPTVSISGNTVFCQGQTTTLTATGANSYLWNNGSFSNSIVVTPSVSLTYTANGTSGAGCTGMGTISIIVNAAPVVSITGGGTICAGQSVTLSANGAGTYTWNTGPTTSTIVVSPTVNTTYSVAGTSTAGCAGNTSTVEVTVVICTGLNSQNIFSTIRIFPNPNSGEFMIECAGGINVELSDISGRIIFSGSSTEDHLKINMIHFANGIYYAKINSGNGYRVFKVVKE